MEATGIHSTFFAAILFLLVTDSILASVSESERVCRISTVTHTVTHRYGEHTRTVCVAVTG